MEEKKRVAKQEAGPPLQCPRCGSNNTKFCYYNNYNTAQPRHFCRDCHRYWTHGGALRNIPAPGESTNRKRNRRSSTGTAPPTAPGPSKIPRIRADHQTPALAIPLPPPPPPQLLFGEGIGMVGSGFSLRPTLSLFNQGLAGLRGFQPFNPLMMPPPPPPPPLSMQLFQGFSMNQVLNVNAGEGSSGGANGASDDSAGERGNINAQDGNINGGDMFANQFFTRFSDGEGGETRGFEFNAGSNDDGNQTDSDAPAPPPPPASFI